MKNSKDLLIVERSSSALTVDKNENKDYVLEGIFGQIDQKNRNNRIYTEDEYVPQIEALQAKIKSSKLLGELDHPTQFDTSLKNVSHIVEELYYDKDTKEVRGKIRLLDTDAGRQAKALVDAGVPLQISSRAAGAVESNGKVKIKQLFTYDLVADPGFENAELKRVNESYGFSNDDGIYIYEMGGESNILENNSEQEKTDTQIKENQNMAEFVKAEDFNKYSEYLAKEIKSIKEAIDAKSEVETTDVDEKITKVIGHGDHIAESVNKIGEYVGYLAGKLDDSIQYTEHVAEKTDQGIQYSEELAEKLDQSIQYSEHVAEKLDEGIQYTEHVAEGVSKLKDFANYLAEAHNENTASGENIIEYVNYLKENMQSISEYAEYIAESINENLVTEDSIVLDVTDPKAKDLLKLLKKHKVSMKNLGEGPNGWDEVELTGSKKDLMAVISDEDAGWGDPDLEEYIEESNGVFTIKVKSLLEGDAGIEGEEVVKKDEEELEEIGDNGAEGGVEGEEAGQEAEEGAEGAADGVDAPEEVHSEEDKGTQEEADDEMPEDEGEDGASDPLEAYKKEVSSKLDALVESATKAENENPSFFRIVSSTTQSKYNELNEAAKTEVRQIVSKRGFMTESEIVSLIEKSNMIVESRQAQPFVLEAMPAEYADVWSNLSEAKHNQILAQSKYHKLETEYQVRNFWQTRDLRESASVMEKIEMIKESKEVEENKGLGYDVTGYAEQFKKRFNK